MALSLSFSLPICSKLKLKHITAERKLATQCCWVSSASPNTSNSQAVVRRSGNYKPPAWNFEFVQSLNNPYSTGNDPSNRITHLKQQVRIMLNEAMGTLDQLEVIDILQRLGLAYHFQDEIQMILTVIYDEKRIIIGDLYSTALAFRLLRDHGFSMSSQEAFGGFQDELGNFKPSLCEDPKGLLSLYEASFLSEGDENILDAAREFAVTNLKKFVVQNKDSYLAELIERSLDIPLHWRMLRREARWFIDMYEKKQGMNPLLRELAILDFNTVQAVHQADLQHSYRWWKRTRLGEKLSFARDRMMENFLWTVGEIYEPQFGSFRRMSTKLNALITTIDDIYDVYGTLEELELFTEAVERWNVNEIDRLPDYMKTAFLALHNAINEMSYDVLNEHGVNAIPYLKKAWADLCRAYLLEAKWYHSGYTPRFGEYMENAWITMSCPLILVHSYFFTNDTITADALNSLRDYPDMIRLSSTIFRLADDLGTSSDELKRGDVPKALQCYMKETGASEEEAREHVEYLVRETWKKMNKERHVDSPFSKTFISIAVNIVRMAQCIYQHGDGYAGEVNEIKDLISSLFVQPIPTM